VKVEARGFVTEKIYDEYGSYLNRYSVSIVCKVASASAQAAITGVIPIAVFVGSDVDRSLEAALVNGKLVKISVEIDEELNDVNA
jgi:hypothetical protein